MEDAKRSESQAPICSLWGFMGAGKTTLGRKAAEHLGWDFLDLDERIVAKAGKSVSDIFAISGEAAFRRLESESLQEILQTPREKGLILATGGGTPCNADNLALLTAESLSIYLQLSPEALAERLTPFRDKRPLLAALSAAELVDWIRERLETRQKWYQQAALTLEAAQLTPEVLSAKIGQMASGTLP